MAGSTKVFASTSSAPAKLTNHVCLCSITHTPIYCAFGAIGGSPATTVSWEATILNGSQV